MQRDRATEEQAAWVAIWAGLFRRNLVRIVGGWRWKIFAAITLAGCYYGSRQPGFGPGAVVWFPMAWTGIDWFTVFLALAGAVLGVEVLGQWHRRRAMVLLQTRLLAPMTFATANLGAAVVACFLPAALAVLWAPLGAWWHGYLVLFTPNLLYLAAVAVPVLISGVSAGFFARALIRSDLGALAAAAPLLAPLLLFRLRAAPASEFFSRASLSLGVLVPSDTLLREAALAIAWGLPFLAAGALLLPSATPRSLRPRPGPSRHATAPGLVGLLRRVPLQLRQWHGLEHLGAVLVLVACLPAAVAILRALPERSEGLDWSGLRPPGDAFPGPVPALRIVERRLDLSGGESAPLIATLTVSAPGEAETASLGAFGFGRALEAVAVESDSEGRSATMVPNSMPLQSLATMVRIDPPLARGEEVALRFTVRPRPLFRRVWASSWHPRFRSFGHLGPWYGEALTVNFPAFELTGATQAAPFTVLAPADSGLAWTSGPLEATTEGGTAVLRQPLRSVPGRLMAADMVTVSTDDPALASFRFRVQPGRRELAKAFFVIYGRPMRNLQQLLGDPAEPLLLYEVPDAAPLDPLAMSSATLDALQALLPGYNDYERSTRGTFEGLFPRLHAGMVSEYFTAAFRSAEYPVLLQDSLAGYLHTTALWSGHHAQRQTLRRLLVRPFAESPPPDGSLAGKRERPAWLQPLLPRLWPSTVTPLAESRARAFHHMLRGLMGDDAWAEFLGTLMREERGRDLTLDAFRRHAEAIHGEPLGWFFDQWLVEGVLPEYRVEKAQAFLLEDPVTKSLQYRVTVTTKNHGTGRMPVPWLLTTEGDPIEGSIWLDAGETREIEQVTVDRPVAFRLDPDNMIAQFREGTSDPRQIVFRTITGL